MLVLPYGLRAIWGMRRREGGKVISTNAQWLGSLGMSEYAARFAENRIDVSVLRDLTDQDLKDLGVVLGDRRKILRAIAALDETLAGAAGIDSTEPMTRTPPNAAKSL